MEATRYFVIPLSVQKDGDLYLIGNADLGDFYQFPEHGLRILNMLQAGDTAPAIRARVGAETEDRLDVDDFLRQLSEIGFIHPEDQKESAQRRLHTSEQDSRRTFNVDARVARAILSPPVLSCCCALALYAVISAINNPALRINFNAFYIATARTPFLLLIMSLSMIHIVLHESGHMLAAARHGIKSKYGVGNRLWTIVAESDLTGILTLPKSQRYFPMLAGIMVDMFFASLLTVLIQILLRAGAGDFAVQVVQALVLDLVISILWEFDIFVKTDVYYVLCNFFSQPDLDRDARLYLSGLIHRISFGLLGARPATEFRRYGVLRTFSLIWLLGRLSSFVLLIGVFLPTMGRYIASAVYLLDGPPASFWSALDTIGYVAIILTMLGIGMYLWLRQKSFRFAARWRKSNA
jgi:hypothetical protein